MTAARREPSYITLFVNIDQARDVCHASRRRRSVEDQFGDSICCRGCIQDAPNS